MKNLSTIKQRGGLFNLYTLISWFKICNKRNYDLDTAGVNIPTSIFSDTVVILVDMQDDFVPELREDTVEDLINA